jgi:hypothetical protein
MDNAWKSALASLLALTCALAGVYAAKRFLRQNQERAQAAAAAPAQAR